MSDNMTEAIMTKLSNLSDLFEKYQRELLNLNSEQLQHKHSMKKREYDLFDVVFKAKTIIKTKGKDGEDDIETEKSKYTNDKSRDNALQKLKGTDELYKEYNTKYVEVSENIAKANMELNIVKFTQKNVLRQAEIQSARLNLMAYTEAKGLK